MKLKTSRRKAAALTLVEVLVVIGILALLAAILLPALATAKRRSSRLGCVSNLKQIGLSFRIWSGDNFDKYPMSVSVTNGGAMEPAAAGDATAVFQVMSNILSTPKILLCPNDAEHSLATNFGPSLTGKNISYFVGLDAAPQSPSEILSGDDNFQIGGGPVASGRLDLQPATPVRWTDQRHKLAGNVVFADGSVQAVQNSELPALIQKTGLATNRLVIP